MIGNSYVPSAGFLLHKKSHNPRMTVASMISFLGAVVEIDLDLLSVPGIFEGR